MFGSQNKRNQPCSSVLELKQLCNSHTELSECSIVTLSEASKVQGNIRFLESRSNMLETKLAMIYLFVYYCKVANSC